ncbi:MAG TPA: hypothetical protein VKB58_02495 [Terriglobales bacterium]|nr:hypothetical protein [Terriglobales bacterium]
MKVLGDKLPASALQQFHGKKVGGQELISAYDQLSALARSGVLSQLDILYVSPGASA